MKKVRQKIIVIIGPTAVGKSALAVELAREFNGEIISADSRQVYKGLDIGSGKITARQMRGVPHHMLDMASPTRVYSVARYKKDGQKVLRKIFKKNRTPIIVGGTGFYIDSLLGRVTLPDVPPDQALRKKLSGKSAVQLFAMLKKLDRKRAQTVDRHNPVRLIRAIEIAKYKTPDVLYLDARPPSEYEISWIGLTLPPEELKKRIHARLISRLKQGMVAEVKKLRQQGVSWKRLYDLGLEYRYVSLFLQGKLSRAQMIEKIETESSHYAKRQMVWFKRNKEIKWFNSPENISVKKYITEYIT